MATTCRIHIDGQLHEVSSGQRLQDVLQHLGMQVPTLCHHPGLSAAATCRSCLVLVAWGDEAPRPATACNHTIVEGMQVYVERADSRALREAALGEVLQRHRVDCPQCERAGECELQEAVAAQGPATTPSQLPPAAGRQLIGPRLVFDAGRCIQCGRCVRFEDEVSGLQQLAMAGRGTQPGVVAATDGVDHPLTGNLVDLCPSAALIDPEAVHEPPAWTLRTVDTVCGACSTGCAVRADLDASGQVRRLKPRQDEAVNGWWMCDRGRYGFDSPDTPRLTAPWPPVAEDASRQDGWQVGVDRLRRRFQQPRSAVWLSPYLTLEEAYLLLQAAEAWGASLFHWTADGEPVQRFASGFRIGSDAAPNTTGLHRLFETLGVSVGSSTQLQEAIAAEQVGQLLVCGGGPLTQRPPFERDRISFVAAIDLAVGAEADLIMPASHWLEKEGTFLNHDAQLRRVRPAREPASGCTDLSLMLALAGREPMTAAEVFEELARRCEWLDAADYQQLDVAARSVPQGVAAGGAWLDSLQRQGLIVIEDVSR